MLRMQSWGEKNILVKINIRSNNKRKEGAEREDDLPDILKHTAILFLTIVRENESSYYWVKRKKMPWIV